MYILKDNYLFLLFLLHIILAAITFFISNIGSKRLDRVGVWLIALSYTVIIFSRQGLGVDEPTYRAAYEIYLTAPSLVEFEFSFKFVLFLFKCLSISPDIFNNLICCIYVFFVAILVSTTVKSPYKTLCILLFLYSSVSLDFIFNAYRQGFAFIFVFAFLMAYESGRKKSSLLYFAIAVGFHWSSIIILLLLLCFKLVPKKRLASILTLVILLTIIGFTFPIGIVPTLNKIITLIPYNNYYFNKISFYLSTSISSIYDLNFFGRLPLLVSTVLILVICRCYYRYIDTIWLKLITAIGLYCVVFMEMSYSFRNYYWLLPLLPFVLCNALSNYRNYGLKNSSHYVVIIIFGHMVLSILTYYTSPLIPLVFLNS